MIGFTGCSRILKSVSLFTTVMAACLAAPSASAQACPAQNWAGAAPNVWAADGSIKVMLNNDATTNEPTIPTYADDGNFNPWGFEQHPQAITQMNDVWSCPSGNPTIAIAGAGRETVSFQVFISASASAGLSGLSVTLSPLSGAGTLTSDNTGTSNITRFLEGYVPYSGLNPTSPPQLQANGQMPDPLIPFYDPYDPGNPAVATPFNVQPGTTQGVWVNVAIPANQAAGNYTGTLTVSGNGITTTSIPVTLAVWNGNLPAFDAGSVNATYADMLKSWLPFYRSNFDGGEGLTCGGPGCATELALYEKYQVMGHAYDIDVQMDADSPAINGCYPSSACTSFTTDGTTSALDWTAYDAYEGPALTPGALFPDGTAMRVFDTPLSTAGSGGWPGSMGKYGYSWYDNNYDGYSGGLVPSGLAQLYGNLATQTSQHFAANHANKGWALPELIAYDYDETDNDGGGQVGSDPQVYQNIALFNAAINNSNTALSSTWAASTAPIRTFLTDMPACPESGDYYWYSDATCADHINLSYPGGPNATAGYSNAWVTTWSPNPTIFMPGRPGPAFHSGYSPTPTLVANTGYQYTFDLTDGVPALSTAPVPIERWFYQGGDPFSLGDAMSNTGVGWRANYWIAYKYGLDETVASTGDPNPAAPAAGGVWDWVGDFWGGYNGASSPSDCSNGNTPSPFVNAATNGDGVLFYPGNEVGCYYSANPVGQAALTVSPAVNTGCAANGYSTCNGISGPVASMRLETVRRGYEDYEYMYLLGKQKGRAAALAIINSMGAAGMTDGGDGTTSWNALDWTNVTGSWYMMGVEPESAAYSGDCVDPSPGIGGLPGGLPNGPTGAGSSSGTFNYGPCPGEWTNNPYRYERARVEMAQQLGFAAASTAPSITAISPSTGDVAGGTTVTITGTNFSGATDVQFGGVSASSFTVNSPTSITAVTPAGSGPVDVQVVSADSVSAYSDADIYTYVSATSPAFVATPTFSVAPGNYGAAQTVTISDTTSGASIYYTTDGTTPTISSNAYSGPIVVSSTETVQAIAVVSGYAASSVASASYVIETFTFTSTDSGAAIVSPGGSAAFSFSLSPSAVVYPGAITFSATGLPTGATAAFSPSTVSATAGTQAVTMTVHTTTSTALTQPQHRPNNAPWLFALALPLLAGFGLRRRTPRVLAVLLVLGVSLAGMSMLSGCSSGNPSQPSQTYAVTVTASGGSQQQTVTVYLTVR